jgi:D-amino-acid oxidase
VCGRHGDSASLARPKRWSMVSYHVYKHMASTKDLSEYYGVRMRETVFFFNEVVKNNKDLLRKMRDTEQSGVAGFRHDSSVTNDIGFSIDKNLWPDAYQLLSPVIDTDLSLIQITSLVRDKGAALVTRTLDGKLIDQELGLLREFNADVMVNASGLSSFFLAGDDKVQALEGAVLRFRRDEGSPFAGLNKALIVSAMDHHEVKSE